jgi:hypothetical protein
VSLRRICGATALHPGVYELAKAKGCLIVICYLFKNGPSTKYSLVRNLKLSKEGIDHAIEVLTDLGLCLIEQSDAFPFAKTIDLTPEGLQLATKPVKDLPVTLSGHEIRQTRDKSGL